MSKTRNQLANRALAKLLADNHGSPAAEDTETVDAVIDAMSETLSSQHIYTIPDLEEIDEDAFEWLAEYLAYLVSPDFGQPRDETKRQLAEFMLKQVTASLPTYERMTAEYF